MSDPNENNVRATHEHEPARKHHVESELSVDAILKRTRTANYVPAVSFKRLEDGCVLIAPTKSAWQGRYGPEAPPVWKDAATTIDFAEARRAQLARRELERARAAAVERERDQQALA
jgi:hypothetical protein